jgi:PAS domain S-box-containing protein
MNIDEQVSQKIIDFFPDPMFAIDVEGKVIVWNKATEELTGMRAEDVVGKGDYEHAMAFYGERRPMLVDLMLKPDEKIEKKYYFVKRESNILIAESFTPNTLDGEGNYSWSKASLLYDSKGKITGAIQVMRDITEKKNTERELLENETKLRHDLRIFTGLYDLVIEVSAEKSLDEKLQFIADKCRDIFDADTSYITLCDDKHEFVNMHTVSGIRTQEFMRIKMPYGKGLGGLVMKTKRGAIVENYLGSKNIVHVVDDLVRAEGLVSGIAVPIQSSSADLGVLYIFNREETQFSEEEMHTLELFGHLMAVEVMRKRDEYNLKNQMDEMEKVNRMAIDRELKMADLKNRIKELENKLKESS